MSASAAGVRRRERRIGATKGPWTCKLRENPPPTTTIRTVDAHAKGGPLRLVVGGFPVPRGRSMFEKREWANRHADHLRRIVMLEPRGHPDLCGALLTEPASPGAHAGLLFMDNEGFGDVLEGSSWIVGEHTFLADEGDPLKNGYRV